MKATGYQYKFPFLQGLGPENPTPCCPSEMRQMEEEKTEKGEKGVQDSQEISPNVNVGRGAVRHVRWHLFHDKWPAHLFLIGLPFMVWL